jgi:D-lyxose ketol-isomerase
MKRSEINREIKVASNLFHKNGFRLPPFAYMSPEEWSKKGDEIAEIVDNRLGWDVTDFGVGDFARLGLLLFTLRNGNSTKKASYPKNYAEKIMVIKEGQVAPMHFHWEKQEDIINRGGGNLVLELYSSTLDEKLANKNFHISVDGCRRECEAGEKIILTPGESIFLEPEIYHSFYTQKGSGAVVIGEVSQVNDDLNDNRFLEPLGRFPEIEEDEDPLHLLCTDYRKWMDFSLTS